MDETELRRRRARFRAAHRGTKEMDLLLGRYAEARLDGMSEAELSDFEALLSLPDPELQNWILHGVAVPVPQHAALIGRLRAFHKLDAAAP